MAPWYYGTLAPPFWLESRVPAGFLGASWVSGCQLDFWLPVGFLGASWVSGGKLPESFWRANAQGVKGGIESAFMSTTFDREVAMHYASQPGKPALVFEMRMGSACEPRHTPAGDHPLASRAIGSKHPSPARDATALLPCSTQ